MTNEEKLEYCTHRGFSFSYYEYWAMHGTCEVCEATGVSGMISEPPHHLKTRGAGGEDEAENLIALCVQHHRMIHNVGDLQIGRMVGGQVQAKINAAKKRLTARA